MIPPVKLLVVEDDMNVATILEARLKTFGYQVCEIARTGPEAVRCALEHRPDLVLMDILLQGNMNGIEAAELIHKQIDMPIVFITCLRDQHMLDRVLKANAYGYILKPYDNAELRYTLQIALIKYQSAKEREKLIKNLEQALTERKHAEKALLASNETLGQKVIERTREKEARAKQLQTLAIELIEAEEHQRHQFAQLLHDDLQQILAAARLHLQMAIESSSAEHLLMKVDQLLDESISKARRLSHEMNPPVLHHSGLAEALKWLTGQMKVQFGLDVELETAEVHIESTPLKMFVFRAVKELLFNITKHADVTKARVVLSCSDKNLAVMVSDQGNGFDSNGLDPTTAGNGLGLLSIRERARYIGGNLEIKSVRGKGSRFTLKVPLSMTKNVGHGVGNDPEIPKCPLDASKEADIRVLFVDDHKVMRQGLIQLITRQPDICVAGEADNGLEALELTRQILPDVIVMDISMPEMDGIEATRHIKAELPQVRVIGLTMHDDEQLTSSMQQAGAEASLSKTVSAAELIKAIYGNK